MPHPYLPYAVEIICYSFTDSQESFDKFLSVIKDNCSQLYEVLKPSDFQSLLQSVSIKVKKREAGFFRTLDQATLVLHRAFELLKEKKIDKFSSQVVLNLVNGNHEFFNVIRHRPSILKGAVHEQLTTLAQELLALHGDLEYEHILYDKVLQSVDLIAFQNLSIS